MPEADLHRMIDSVSLARAALEEITPPATIGEPSGHIVEADGSVSLFFHSNLSGYPGWRWTVTLGLVTGDSDPTVLEAELVPGEGSLVAPEWVPWSERLAEYQKSLAASEAQATHDASLVATDADLDDDDLDDDDDDDEIDDEGDIDGIDIDSAFDEETDVDADLDLSAEESLALRSDDDTSD